MCLPASPPLHPSLILAANLLAVLSIPLLRLTATLYAVGPDTNPWAGCQLKFIVLCPAFSAWRCSQFSTTYSTLMGPTLNQFGFKDTIGSQRTFFTLCIRRKLWRFLELLVQKTIIWELLTLIQLNCYNRLCERTSWEKFLRVFSFLTGSGSAAQFLLFF